MRIRTLFLLLLATLVLSACSWMNPFSSRAPKPAELQTFQERAELRPLWQVRVGDGGHYLFQPAVAGDSVYVAGQNGRVERIDAGSRSWNHNVGASLSAGVGSDGRTVAVVTERGELVALEASTGEERWRTAAGVEVLAPPGVSGRTVVVRASDSRLLGFDAQSGERRWVYQRNVPPLSLRNTAGMLVDGDVAVVGFPGGKMVAINLLNGGALWELTVSMPRGVTELERVADVAGVPVVGHNDVCAVTYQGRAACFDLSNGSVAWSREFSSSAGMDHDGRRVYITSADDAVHALDAASGASVWKQGPLERRRLSRPLALDNAVVFGDLEGYVHALDRNNGSFIARGRAGSSAIEAAPVRIGPRSFVVQTRDGSVQAFEVR